MPKREKKVQKLIFLQGGKQKGSQLMVFGKGSKRKAICADNFMSFPEKHRLMHSLTHDWQGQKLRDLLYIKKKMMMMIIGNRSRNNVLLHINFYTIVHDTENQSLLCSQFSSPCEV